MKNHERIIVWLLFVFVVFLMIVTANQSLRLGTLYDEIGTVEQTVLSSNEYVPSIHRVNAEQGFDLLELFERISDLENNRNFQMGIIFDRVEDLETITNLRLGILQNYKDDIWNLKEKTTTTYFLLCGRVGSVDEGIVHAVTGENCNGRTRDQDYCLAEATKFGETPERYEFYDECIKEIKQ